METETLSFASGAGKSFLSGLKLVMCIFAVINITEY